MTDVVLNSSSMSPANPATPPAGWQLTAGSVNGIQVASNQIWFDTDNSYSGWNYTSAPARTGNIIESKIVLGVSPNGFVDYYQAVTLVDSSGAGYMFEIQPYAFKLYRFSSGNLAGTKTQIGTASSGVAPVDTDYFNLSINASTGAITGSKNGVSVVTATDTTYTANSLKSGFAQKGFSNRSGISQVTAFDVTVYSVTSINGGAPFTASQTSGTASITGFSGVVTSITSNLTGLSFSGIGGTATDPTYTKSVPIDGAVYPKRGSTATLTFSKGAETADGTILINKDADQTAVIVASPFNDDITCLFGAIFAATGRSAANGDEVYHAIPTAMLTNGVDTILPADAIAPDGTMQFYNAGSFPCWVWTAATGINYYYLVTITESGGVIISGGLTTRGLTVSGLTVRGLTTRGL